MGLITNLVEHLYSYHTNHYKKNLYLLFVYDFIGSCVLNLIHFYQYNRLQILQQEDHEVDSHRL